MKKFYSVLILIFLCTLTFAQNKNSAPVVQKAGQNEDDVTSLRKNVNSLSLQVKNLQNKVNALSSEQTKKISNFDEDIKTMDVKVNNSNAMSEAANREIKELENNSSIKFNNVTKSILKRSNFIFAFSLLIALFIIIVFYYLNSNLNKNVKSINESIGKIMENADIKISELKMTLESQLQDNSRLLDARINEFVSALERDIKENNDLLNNKVREIDNKYSESNGRLLVNINNINDQLTSQIKINTESLNNKISKSIDEIKINFDKQIAEIRKEKIK